MTLLNASRDRDVALPDDEDIPPEYLIVANDPYHFIFKEAASRPTWFSLLQIRKLLQTDSALLSSLSYLRRFLDDQWKIGGTDFVIALSGDALLATLPAIKIANLNKLLNVIEQGVISGQINVFVVRSALLVIIGTSFVDGLIRSYTHRTMKMLKQRVRRHYGFLLLQASLSKNFSEFDGDSPDASARPPDVIQIFECMRFVLDNIVSFISSLCLVLQLGRTSKMVFLLLLVPFIKHIIPSSRSYRLRGKVYWVSNPLVRRILSIEKMIKKREFCQEPLHAF